LSALAAALDPASVAIFGASNDPDRIGGRPLWLLARHGYAGQVYPINPTRRQVQGLPSYPDLAALPAVPDVALVAVPGLAAEEAVASCAAAGVKVAIVLSSGFGEVSEDGRQAQDRMVAAARAAGMRMLGPNCYGVANVVTGAMLTFSTVLVEQPPLAGPVAVVSQSGSMSIVPYVLLRERGIGIRGVYGTGNDADVTVGELAAEVARDPGVELVLLYLETIRDAAAFAELAAVARGRDLPVVALKAGRTSAGERAARSHTGALANEDRLVDAFFERHGIWRARDCDDLVRAAALHLGPSRPQGRRTVVVSNSGASGVQAADAASDRGLPLSELAPETRDALDGLLPGFASSANPVDLTAALIGNSGVFSEVLPLVGADPAVDAVLIALQGIGRGYGVDELARASGEFARQTRKPVVVATCQSEIQAVFRGQGLAAFATEASAADALDQYLSHHALLEVSKRRHPAASAAVTAPSRAGAGTDLLDEAAALDLVAAAGVPVVAHWLCRDADGAVAALAALGPPVAVKGCSARAPHKTELGLVRLGLVTEGEVRAAVAEIAPALHRVDPGAPGMLVASMARGIELLIGAHFDQVFGPVILVGAGGAEVEVLADVAALLPPISGDEVLEVLSRLRVAPRLSGIRGAPPADLDAFVTAVLAVQRLLLNPDAAVWSLDLNPVLVGPVGTGCVAVDAMVERFA
jgi:acyl-CoA synthetase (NDP forming)